MFLKLKAPCDVNKTTYIMSRLMKLTPYRYSYILCSRYFKRGEKLANCCLAGEFPLGQWFQIINLFRKCAVCIVVAKIFWSLSNLITFIFFGIGNFTQINTISLHHESLRGVITIRCIVQKP